MKYNDPFSAKRKNNTCEYRWFCRQHFDMSQQPMHAIEGDAHSDFDLIVWEEYERYFFRLFSTLVFYNSLSAAIFIITTPNIWFGSWIFIQIIKFKIIAHERRLILLELSSCFGYVSLTYGNVRRPRWGTNILELHLCNAQNTTRKKSIRELEISNGVALCFAIDPLGIQLLDVWRKFDYSPWIHIIFNIKSQFKQCLRFITYD